LVRKGGRSASSLTGEFLHWIGGPSVACRSHEWTRSVTVLLFWLGVLAPCRDRERGCERLGHVALSACRFARARRVRQKPRLYGTAGSVVRASPIALHTCRTLQQAIDLSACSSLLNCNRHVGVSVLFPEDGRPQAQVAAAEEDVPEAGRSGAQPSLQARDGRAVRAGGHRRGIPCGEGGRGTQREEQ